MKLICSKLVKEITSVNELSYCFLKILYPYIGHIMDITDLFKACVKTVRLRNKTTQDKNRILKTRMRDEFLLKANEVKYQVTQLKDLLVENRASYMRFGYHLKTATQMTDTERDIIDLESEKIIMICNQYVNDLKLNILKSNIQSKEQLIQHKLAILDILSHYLKNVFQMHSKQRRNRIQHEMDTLKLLKLESRDMTPSNEIASRNDLYSTKSLSDRNLKVPKVGKANILDDNIRTRVVKNENPRKVALDEDQANKFALEDENPNTDDFQLFESENTQLLNELKGLTDEVDQIEKNVVGIAKLQEIFTEKVSISKSFSYSYDDVLLDI